MRDRINLVYLNNDPKCNLAAALGAKLAGLPMVLHARRFHASTRGTRWVFENITHCIAVSNAVRSEARHLGLRWAKCTVVPDGLDLTRFRPHAPGSSVLTELGINAGEPVITLVGGLGGTKGQDILLVAARRILLQFPNTRIFVLGEAYGNDLRYVERLRLEAQAPELRGRVQILGARSDVEEILAASNIVLHASAAPEPFGRTCLESMALGKPVIAPKEGGPLDFIEHGVDGLLIRPGEPEELARNVIRLLSDTTFAAMLGDNAANTARRYSIERHSDAICNVLLAAASTGLRSRNMPR